MATLIIGGLTEARRMYVTVIRSDPRAREKPCLRCGLSLRKLLDAKHCPDCGLSAWLSLNPNDALDWSRPAWLLAGARGAMVLAAAYLLGFAAYGLAMAGYWNSVRLSPHYALYKNLAISEWDEQAAYDTPEEFDGAASTTAPASPAIQPPIFQPPPPSRLIAMGAVAGGAALALNAIGLVFLTTHERRYPDVVKPIRAGARVTAGLSAALGIGLLAIGIARLESGWSIWPPAMGWKWGVQLISAASAICTWAWLGRIARRSGHSTLARLCGYLLFLPLLPLLKFTPLVAIGLIYFILGLLDYLSLLYLPTGILLLTWFARLLQRSSAMATENWAKESIEPAGDR